MHKQRGGGPTPEVVVQELLPQALVQQGRVLQVHIMQALVPLFDWHFPLLCPALPCSALRWPCTRTMEATLAL